MMEDLRRPLGGIPKGEFEVREINDIQIDTAPKAGHYRHASETPFKWRFAGGPIVVRDCIQAGIQKTDRHKQTDRHFYITLQLQFI